jgi:hypothetical protein
MVKNHMKNCSKCNTEKDLGEFAIYDGKPFSWCRVCQRKSNRESKKRNAEQIKAYMYVYNRANREKKKDLSSRWRANNLDKAREICRRADKKRREEDPNFDRRRNIAKYGMTMEKYAEMLNSQGGVCAICKKGNSVGRNLAIDHNHSTGVVRELLCHNCNFAIGYAKEDTSILEGMIAYIKKHETLVSTGVI